MKSRVFWLCAALALVAAYAAAPALADESDRPSDPPKADPPKTDQPPTDQPKGDEPADKPVDKPAGDKSSAEANVIRFDNNVRLNVQHDLTTGALTFRSTDTSVRLAQPPVVVVSGREYPLAMVEPGVWRVSNEVFRTATFPSATVRIVSDGKTYTSPLVMRAATATLARHGGHLIRLAECGSEVEVVRDVATGRLMVYPVGELQLVEAPIVTVTTTEEKGPATLTLTKVEGQTGVWQITHPTFKTTTTTTTTVPTARIRIVANGRTCEAPLVFSRRGGQIVMVSGGPRFEVVPDPAQRTYTFYALDDTLEGKPYTIENPQVVVMGAEGTRTYTLAPVPGEQRAWRMVGLDANIREPLDGMLRFTLFGRSLETNVGLSGLNIGVR